MPIGANNATSKVGAHDLVSARVMATAALGTATRAPAAKASSRNSAPIASVMMSPATPPTGQPTRPSRATAAPTASATIRFSMDRRYARSESSRSAAASSVSEKLDAGHGGDADVGDQAPREGDVVAGRVEGVVSHIT